MPSGTCNLSVEILAVSDAQLICLAIAALPVIHACQGVSTDPSTSRHVVGQAVTRERYLPCTDSIYVWIWCTKRGRPPFASRGEWWTASTRIVHANALRWTNQNHRVHCWWERLSGKLTFVKYAALTWIFCWFRFALDSTIEHYVRSSNRWVRFWLSLLYCSR